MACINFVFDWLVSWCSHVKFTSYIPAISSIYLYKKWTNKKINKFSKFTLINIIGIALLGFIFFIIVPQTVNLFGKTELYFVNTLGFSFNSGTIFFLIFLALTISLA